MAVYDFFSTIHYYQTIQWNGVNQPQEEILNFIAQYSITVSDDPTNNRTNITFAPNLESLASFSALGVVVYTGSNTFTARTITGTTNQITVTNGNGVAGNPTIAISATYPGQTSISTLGTIITGTWNGNIVTGQYGGTGVNNGSNTITLGGNLATSGAFPLTFTLTGSTNITLPTSGTLLTDPTTTKGDLITRTSSALVRLGVGSDGTILTADSTQTTGLRWAASSITSAYSTVQNQGTNLTQRSILNFVGSSVTAVDDSPNTRTNITFATILNNLSSGTPLPLANGGTNANLTANNGGIFYSTATAGAILAGTSTANQILLSGSSSAPSWSTATYPSSTTANQILYSNATNTVTGLATGNNGVLITSGAGVPSISSTLPTVVQGNITSVGTIATGIWQGTAIGVVYGGTGLNSINQGDLLYGSALNTIAALAKNTNATRYLSNTGTSNSPAWAQVDLTTGVTNTLPISSGGTGQTTKTAAYNALNPNTTQGDITYFNGTNNVRLGAGTAGQFLQTQGTSANPIWALAGGALNVQNFTSSGTWTKPSGGTWAFIQAWGAGGSGGSSNNATGGRGGGGGGGAYYSAWIQLSLLGSTETVTIGAGGALVSGNTSGNAGGNSTFGAWVTGYGGGGGGGTSSTGGVGGGGGGGVGAVGQTNTGGATGIGGRGVTTNTVCAGGALSSDGSIDSGGGGASGSGSVGGKGYYGGGGGGGGSVSPTVTGGTAGTSTYGGGGGGGSSGTASGSAGGTSQYTTGTGGVGGNLTTAGTAGSAPGGGGGGTANNQNSGAGANGLIIVIVI
jgi:glycine rich protein